MDYLFKLLPHDLPAFIRQEILTELFQATADAFQCPAPAVEQLSYADCLQAYAHFTREQAEQALRSGGDPHAIKTRLFRAAFPLGGRLREWFSVDSMLEVMELGRLLYQAIGVEIEGDPAGNVTVTRCYFSQFYTAPVCDLISALDDGVLSGLSGGGRLVFSERMTEQPAPEARCRAKLIPREEALR
jgi:hypothetical protein